MGDVEVVLRVEGVVPGGVVFELACALLEGSHAAEEEAGEGVAGVVGGEAEDSTVEVGVTEEDLTNAPPKVKV